MADKRGLASADKETRQRVARMGGQARGLQRRNQMNEELRDDIF